MDATEQPQSEHHTIGSTVGKIVKSLVWLALAGAATVGVLLLASRIVTPKDNRAALGQHHPEAHAVAAEPPNTLDALIIGDSEVFSGISPMQMWGDHGITSFACATPAQRLYYSRSFLQLALKTQKPRVVVLETNCIYSPFSATDVACHMIEQAVPLFEYHDRWKSLTAEDFVRAPGMETEDPLKGYALYEGVVPADTSNYMTPTDELSDMPTNSMTLLRWIRDDCERAGAKLILVSTPSTKCWNMSRHNRTIQIAKDLGVDYYDFNTGDTKVDIDWSKDTRDAGDHLNTRGATKTSQALGAILSKEYGLPDHRSDPTYAQWDKDWESYQARVAALSYSS